MQKIFRADNNNIVKDNNKADKIFKNFLKFKKLKNIKFDIQSYIKAIKKPLFTNFSTKQAFNLLK